MGIPGANFTDAPIYRPKFIGVKELNIGDAWRATWVGDEDLPEGAPVLYGYVVVLSGDKGYVSRRAGATTWGVAEGAVRADEDPVAFAKRLALEQTGVTAGKAHILGYYECRATSHNPDFPVGTTTVRPIYLFAATKLKDIGRDAGFERRRLPLNEFAKALRTGYPELAESIPRAVDHYLILQSKGEA